MTSIHPDQPIHQLLSIETPKFNDEEIERHRIFMLLSLTLVYDNWCIYRTDHKMLARYVKHDPSRYFNDYLGHNIGAILVNPDHEIVAASMNCNHLYNNSTQHAETRLVRKAMRIYNRKNYRSDRRKPKNLKGYSQVLQDHTIYTTLESCSQCSGIMDLANVSTVVYAQKDPGQYQIGNILYNLHKQEEQYGAPLPIAADFLSIYTSIEKAWDQYDKTELSPRRRPSLTGFLRSLPAYDAYKLAKRSFEGLEPRFEKNKSIYKLAIAFREGHKHLTDRDALFGP